MPKRFEEESHNHTRALQVWQILIGRAGNQQAITYRELASLMG